MTLDTSINVVLMSRLTIEILSETVRDGRRGHGASDQRDIGVAIREIRLLRD
jgi:hypothetical protein